MDKNCKCEVFKIKFSKKSILHSIYNDHHYFWLNETSLGKWNTEQLKFYKK